MGSPAPVRGEDSSRASWKRFSDRSEAPYGCLAIAMTSCSDTERLWALLTCIWVIVTSSFLSEVTSWKPSSQATFNAPQLIELTSALAGKGVPAGPLYTPPPAAGASEAASSASGRADPADPSPKE